jgi:hypothetical protein
VGATRPGWARPVADPDLPAQLRRLIALGDAASRSERRTRERELARRPGHVISPYDLDWDFRTLLGRAQRAIDDVLRSDVRAAGLLEADEPVLRRHEWEIASALREMAKVPSAAPGDVVGAMTAAVLGAQRHALDLAIGATARRVRALEQYAAEVRAADAARRDLHSAARLAGLNDTYLDLVARTAADDLAITEISQLTEHAADTARILRENLALATATAEVIALPTRAGGPTA